MIRFTYFEDILFLEQPLVGSFLFYWMTVLLKKLNDTCHLLQKTSAGHKKSAGQSGHDDRTFSIQGYVR